MFIIILFGLPGSGKSFVGTVFQKYFDFYFFDGDLALPKNMKRALNVQSEITNDMRDEFFQRLIKIVKKLTKQKEKIIIAQTCIKEKYRELLLNHIPDARFILIQTDTIIRETRLDKRKNYPLEKEYARKMCRNFDMPKIKHEVILNNEDGKENIKKQIELMLKNAG